MLADSFGDLEMSLTWGQSTDDFDAQANIRYDVYVNGRFEDVVFGSGGPRVIYGTGLGENLIEVFATDTAGNTSAAGTFTKPSRDIQWSREKLRLTRTSVGPSRPGTTRAIDLT